MSLRNREKIRNVIKLHKERMLRDNIFVKKEIDSEMAEEFVDRKKRL